MALESKLIQTERLYGFSMGFAFLNSIRVNWRLSLCVQSNDSFPTIKYPSRDKSILNDLTELMPDGCSGIELLEKLLDKDNVRSEIHIF